MDSGPDPVTIVSAAVAGLSLIVSSGALWFARRADQRAERADERAERAFRRADRGQPSAQYLGFSVDKAQGRDTVKFASFKFRVTNVGAAGARHTAVHLIDQTGVELPERSSNVSLAAGESKEVTVGVRDPARYSYPLKVKLEWLHWQRQEPYLHDSSEMVPNPF
jgi:hypothetical protein